MSVHDRIPQDRDSGISPEVDRVESRRRLLKAGLIAVPFLVTLHAVPARAGGQTHGSLGLYGYGGGGGGKGKPRPRAQQTNTNSTEGGPPEPRGSALIKNA